MRNLAFIIAVLGAALSAGCKKDQAPPPATPTGETTAPTVEAPPPESDPNDDPTKGSLNISKEIQELCGISESEAYFAYDSANVRPQDRAVLKKLADCFTTGPAKGREMRLVGHADPRGSDEYNMVLGSHRAENVKRIIVQEGLPSSQAVTTSRGEMDAVGTDEASYAKDRRVDVVLGN